ncbi:ABC transporter permease [Radiobacillus sp. PE A8.2]|uniref:ABC transporter permease n=1 Tax=Radiobacillus sp. PE A8.2 TaxID=3380349 RepID=UPI00388D45CC
MNIVNKLTIRHLKENKRRTLVTIVGVIISVAMITAVATLGVSFLDLLKRQVIAEQGEWHVLYKNLDEEQLAAVQNDDATKSVVLTQDRGYALLEGSENDYKPYVFVKGYDKQGFENFPITLSEGRFPESPNEVVLPEHIESDAGVTYELGSQMTLAVGDREYQDMPPDVPTIGQSTSLQTNGEEVAETLVNTSEETYTVVGFIERPTWEPTWAPGYTIISYIDESTVSADNRVNASIVLNKVNSGLYNHADQLVAENKISSVTFNSELLRYYGVTKNDGLRTTLFSLVAIIMGVIVVGSVALIYNAFAISVSERARHLGMLSSVGATKRQKRNSVLFEGVVIGSISIPIGIIAGLAGMGITFLLINSAIKGVFGIAQGLQLTVTPVSILAACGVSLLTIFISTYMPARKASKISAIDAIRQSQDVKLTGKKVKTSKLVRKLFGIEAEFGLKNLKRNKRRYQITVFSLVISILLFLTVSFFTDNVRRSLVMSQDGIDYDIQVGAEGNGSTNMEELTKFAQLDHITEYNLVKKGEAYAWIDQEAAGEEWVNIIQAEDNTEAQKDSSIKYSLYINALDEASLAAYANSVGVDVAKLQDPEQPRAIVIDTIEYEDYETKKLVNTKAIHAKVGQSLDVFAENWETEEHLEMEDVEVAGITDDYPVGITSPGLGGIIIIVSEQVMDHIYPESIKANLGTYGYFKSSDPIKTQEQLEETMDSNYFAYNVYQARQQEEQILLLMSVFTYGFIVLITGISIANIFNTISTSISLRRREFAMLKSVGMTPKGFNKMINYESIFYGVKALLYGLPLSIGVMFLIHKSMQNTFEYAFELPWISILYVVVAIFVIVGAAMLYSIQKVKKENIIDALKQENA